MARHGSFPRILLPLLVVLALVGTACGSGDEPGAAPARKPGEKITMTFWSWVPGASKSVDLWNQRNPEVQVKLEKIPAGGQGGYPKMFSAIQAGTPPDIAQVEYQAIPNFLLSDGLTDLKPYGVEEHKSKFVDWQWGQGSFGEGVYAIPQASGPMALYYRSDLFEKWGITPPATWAEFEQAARKVRAADPSAYLTSFPPTDAGWFTSLSWQAGAHWFGTEGDTWTVDMGNPQTRKVADYWDRMVKDDLVKVQPTQQGPWYADLQDGKIAAWVGPQWGDAIMAGNAPDTSGKWRVAYMPQWDAGARASANWGGSSSAVLKGAKYPKEAMEFAVWLNSDPESVRLLMDGGAGWPASQQAADGPAQAKEYPFFGGQKINEVFAEADRNVDKNWKWNPTSVATFDHLKSAVQESISGGGTLADALRVVQDKTVADLQTKGLQVKVGG
ncbi:ABC transporter substrate-binding protein [Amycolatopsis nigrescens]|uniref:ABC transporter substrate-binding protein n=1 Tax=Amycolatopsis nigrescens TaxID=381445 RepID=UPI000688B0D6|nr:sugar ABC transporter substrate-binding protein [Amycolatopsis nigrescens]